MAEVRRASSLFQLKSGVSILLAIIPSLRFRKLEAYATESDPKFKLEQSTGVRACSRKREAWHPHEASHCALNYVDENLTFLYRPRNNQFLQAMPLRND